MFDFIRKDLLWSAWDAGHGKELGGGHYHLKTAQDLGVYQSLRDLSGQTIAEIGGGDSRILRRISRNNECFNIEKFEGGDGGPAEEIVIPNVKNIKVFLGENSDLLPKEKFDVVFSVSVIEHIPDGQLQSFFDDGLRILKHGGLWLHAIDMYIPNEPNEVQTSRYEKYRKWIDDQRVSPVAEVFRGPLRFSCDMASNPDQTMYNWGTTAPALINLRKRSQSVSILLAGRKK